LPTPVAGPGAFCRLDARPPPADLVVGERYRLPLLKVSRFVWEGVKAMRWITTALLALMLISGQHAQAAEPRVITLSCDGTLSRTDARNGQPLLPTAPPERIQKAGVVVSLDEQTVSFLGYVAPIKSVDAAYVNFGGNQIGRSYEGSEISMWGEIDRVTGYFEATTTTSSGTKATGYNAVESHYEMLCKAANRVF
jgi:hypothetical protein